MTSILDKDLEILFLVAFGYPAHRSETVDVGEDGSIKYYVDEEMNYYVPQKDVSEIVTII